MSSLGIYFGVKDINLVESRGRKILNSIRLPHPSLAMTEIEEKVQEWLDAGVRLVWVIYPSSRTVTVHQRQEARRLRAEDELTGAPVLPGFSCKVADIFAPEETSF